MRPWASSAIPTNLESTLFGRKGRSCYDTGAGSRRPAGASRAWHVGTNRSSGCTPLPYRGSVEEFLRDVPLFARCPDHVFEELARNAGSVLVRSGEHLFRQGEPAGWMAIV